MASDWLNHKQLMIIKGVGKAPGDTNSPEMPLISFNLMTDGAVTLQDWSPNIPPMKNGGVWSDSPVTDGRQLQAAPVGNVIEKINILLSDKAYNVVAGQLETLNKMVTDCREFWESQYQIDPVYLVWWAGCAPGPQYALIYNIDLAPNYQAATQPTLQVSLSVEREPYWRGIPPGANPKMWTDYVNSDHLPFNLNSANLMTSTDDLVYDTAIKNRMEWNPAGYTSVLSRNYVDIPANKIPGDAPALVSLMIETPGLGPGNGITEPQLFVARSTKPTSMIDRSGANYPLSYIFNAGDAVVGGVGFAKTIDATCGCLSNGSAVNRYIVNNATMAAAAVGTVSFAADGTSRFFDLSVTRGTFIAFIRCKQLNGVAGDVQARLTITEFLGTSLVGQYNNLPLVGAPFGNCNNRFDLLYLGVFTVPFGNKAYSSSDGRGLNVTLRTSAGSVSNLTVDLKNTAASNRNVEILDLILLPIDESVNQLIASARDFQRYFHYDTSGYLSHGFQQTMSIWSTPATNETSQSIVQTLGQDLTLIPRINNRLHFIQRRGNNNGLYYSVPDSIEGDMTIRVNIVPRWSGIRDV